MSRRHFIIAGAGAGVLVSNAELGLGFGTVAQAQDKPLPDYVSWKDAKAMIVHSPKTLETKRDYFGTSGITPADQLYVRNNLPQPGDDVVADRQHEAGGQLAQRRHRLRKLRQLERGAQCRRASRRGSHRPVRRWRRYLAGHLAHRQLSAARRSDPFARPVAGFAGVAGKRAALAAALAPTSVNHSALTRPGA